MEAGLLEEIRVAVANYMRSEGCSCCQNIEDHEVHTAKLAALLQVPPYSDGSGFNFDKFTANPVLGDDES